MLDFAERYLAEGGRYLLVDEVQRYGFGNWAQELKQIYDLYRNRLKVTFTGSSAIQILQQRADLSRRVLQHRLAGLSFREYLLLNDGIELPALPLTEILRNHEELARQITGGP